MPIHDFKCKDCQHEYEDLLIGQDLHSQCPECQSLNVIKKPALIGGYSGNMGSGSTRPRQAGSFKTKRTNK